MPPIYRICEVAVYSLLNFVPFMGLAIYPFRNRLRFSKPVTALLIIGVTIIQLALGVWAAFFKNSNAGIISAISTLLYGVFYFSAVKIHLGKAIFTLLMISNISNMIVMIAKCIEGQLFPSNAIQPYRWSFSLFMFLTEIIILVPLYYYIKLAFTPAVEKEPSGAEWGYLWLIPGIFYLTWYYAIYGNLTRTSLQIALRPGNSVYFFCFNLGGCLIYYVIAKLINEQNKNAELEEKSHRFSMQKLQYENLKEKIAEARRAKHDVRHHITLLQSYVKNHEYSELENYLEKYQKSLPDDTQFYFCENSVVNTILIYYAEQAKNRRITFDAKLDLPEQIGISDADLSVIFGNLLENAVDACESCHNSQNQIVVRCSSNQSSLCLTVDNTFSNQLKRASDSSFVSTKEQGSGIGIKSVSNIVQSHNGVLKIATDNNMFQVSALINY